MAIASDRATNVNYLVQSARKHAPTSIRGQIRTAADSTVAIGEISCSPN